jgi:hypothetical protein
MRKQLLLIALFYNFFGYSQSNQNFDYKVSNPNSENELSLYFKKEIPATLLKSITYPKNKTNFIVYFYVNKENEPYYISFDSYRNSKLNKALKKALEKYLKQNITLDFDTKKKYSFQVIAKSYNENKIICSSYFVAEATPILEKCKDLDFYQDSKSCINKNVYEHFKKSINFKLSEQIKNKNKFDINLDFSVNKQGFLNIDKIKADDVFISDINTVIKSFPRFTQPSLKDSIFNNYKLKIYYKFNRGEIPESKKFDNNFDTIFKPNSSNEFAKYLSENLTEEDIQSANLNRFKDRISLYFEINKKGNPFEIRTTSRSKKLEEKIITLFKNYNVNNLNIIDKTKFNRFFTPIMVFENGENVIKTDSIIGFSRAPIIGSCKKVTTTKEARNCFSRQVQIYFSKKFNPNLPNRLGLSPGRKRISIQFKVNKKGKVTDISCDAPHPKIEQEVIRVMKKLPKATPAIFGLKPAQIKYSIPFTLIVE